MGFRETAVAHAARRKAALVAALALVLAGGMLGAPAVSAGQLTIVASADAYVSADAPAANYGTATTLRIDGSPALLSYVRFDLTGVAAPISNATLQLYANSSSSAGYEVRTAGSGWTETALTYSAAPAPGASVAVAAPFKAGSVTSADVTSAVSAGRVVDLVILARSSKQVSLGSRESSHPPVLSLTLAETSPTPSPTPTTTPTPAPTPTPTATPTPTPTATPSPQTTTLGPSADAYVDASNPSANFGTGTTLRVDGSPVVRSYLKFAVSGLAGTVSRATLRLYANSAQSSGYDAFAVADTSWGETTLTNANAPAFGAKLGSSGPVAAGSWTSVDVTSAIGGNGTVSLGLSTANATALSLSSRSGPNPPQLVIVSTGGGPAPTPTPTATPTATPAPTASPTPSPTASPTASPTPVPSDPILVGAGDICITSSIQNAYATANLVLAEPSAQVFTAGDNSNETGTAAQYAGCVAKAWGQFRDRTHPAPGNHDYMTAGAQPYYDYYGSLAGPAGQGWYSYDLPNNWHVVMLNSQCSEVGGCGTGSPQEVWLRQDLAASAGKHIIAVWHIPAFSSGGAHGNSTAYVAWWQDLYAAHADIVLNGHDHDYERFAPQSPTGQADANGIREFVVGTGGAGQRAFGTIRANSEVRNEGTFGVLKLTLRANSYDWQFVPVAGGTFSDAGTTVTHS